MADRPVGPITIRPSRVDDGPALQEIELRAGEQFRSVGMDSIADATPEPIEALAEYSNAGRSWVAVTDDDQPVGYLIVDTVDGAAHIEQVSVLPEYQGAGIGRALTDRARAWAGERKLPALTLTTFSEVPWNRPLYEHLGFTVMADSEIGPELRAIRDHEAGLGLDPAGRVCMRSRVHE
jgi:ribosomal protein S18 acetylase RimI-like enzyme